jgi:hypothetical protein
MGSVAKPEFELGGLAVDLPRRNTAWSAQRSAPKHLNLLVGVTGFEPATPTSRTLRAERHGIPLRARKFWKSVDYGHSASTRLY